MGDTTSDAKPKFIPEAMLPAWLVTDEHWVVRNWNSFAQQLLATLDPANIEHLESHKFTFGAVDDPEDGRISIWTQLLELDEKRRQMAVDATRVMKDHVAIIRRYVEPSRNYDLQALLIELRRVEGAPGVFPYVFDAVNYKANLAGARASPSECDPSEVQEYLRIGIRVAPPEGLKLRAPLTLIDPENSDPGPKPRPMTHVEIVIGYKVLLWSSFESSSGVTFVQFQGSQPAIHDATERRRLAKVEKELEELRVTSNLAHALRTPLSNAMAAARRINHPATSTDDRRRLSGPLLAQISEADALVRLLLFVNANEPLPVFARPESSLPASMWPFVTPEALLNEIADALMSIFHLRTDRPRDRRTILTLLTRHEIKIPDERNGGEVAFAFRQLATAITATGLGAFALTASIQSLRYSSVESAELARTVALQLILPELVINAVKYCDAADPEINIIQAIGDGAVEWIVENCVALREPADMAQEDMVEESGARGNFLNQKATRILGWRLESFEPRPGWKARRLAIPVEGRER